MTGLGVLRTLKSLGRADDILFFIDSDPAFDGFKVGGFPVYYPQDFVGELAKLGIPSASVTIVLAAALKADELNRTAVENNITSNLINFSRGDESHVTIDVMGACNLKCGSCPHGLESNADVPKGSMSLETFEEVLDKIGRESPRTSHLALYSWGEPFLHPKLPQMLRFAHDRGYAVALSSNLSFGDKFTNRLKDVVREKPEYLKVSVSGWSQEVYETTHQGGDVELVKSNLCLLRDLITEVGDAETLVDINYHLYRNNIQDKELGNFKRLAKDLGFLLSTVHSLVMPVERVFNFIDGDPDPVTKHLNDSLLTVPIRDAIDISSKGSEQFQKCPFAVNQLNINADLSVPVCCVVYSRSGHLVSENFLEDKLDDLSVRKANVKTCSRCMSLRLPEYNLGLNRYDLDRFYNDSIKLKSVD